MGVEEVRGCAAAGPGRCFVSAAGLGKRSVSCSRGSICTWVEMKCGEEKQERK
jgi:hypothetical protein